MKCIDDEIPFEIPQSWCWVRLKSIADVARGGSPRPIKDYITEAEDGINWIKIGDTEKDGKYINYTREKITPAGLKKSRLIHKGDFLLTNSMSFGRPYISNIEGCIHDGWLVISPIGESFIQDYLYYLLSSRFSYDQFCGVVSGAVVQNLNSDKVAGALFPLPPIEEQKRIVEFLESIMPYIKTYELAQSQLDKLNMLLMPKLKKSVLQEAIQGRLVPQDPNDEPASVLLERIREEKQRLLKEGKLKKKDITDSVIFKGEDNKYYEQIGSEVYEIETEMQFPATWELVRLGDICRLVDGEKRSGAYPCLDAKYLRGKSAATILQSGKFVQVGDNIILVDGENSGEVFSVPVDGYMGSTFKQLWISSELHLPYILHFILFYKEQLRNSKKGAAIPHLNKEIFYNLPVGIPPLKEQQKLSESVNILFSKLR